jgi:hypothetical protein
VEIKSNYLVFQVMNRSSHSQIASYYCAAQLRGQRVALFREEVAKGMSQGGKRNAWR